MLIKITKALRDIDQRIRPKVGYCYEVKDVLYGKYHPEENNLKIIDIKGFEIPVSPSECVVMK